MLDDDAPPRRSQPSTRKMTRPSVAADVYEVALEDMDAMHASRTTSARAPQPAEVYEVDLLDTAAEVYEVDMTGSDAGSDRSRTISRKSTRASIQLNV